MEHSGKEKRVYHGSGFIFLMAFIFPASIFALLLYVFTKFTNYTFDVNLYMSLMFGGICGFIFCLSCVIAGLIHDPFEAFIERIKEVFAYFKPFSKEANSWYFYQFKKTGGIIMWLFFLVILLYAAIATYGLVNFMQWYSSTK